MSVPPSSAHIRPLFRPKLRFKPSPFSAFLSTCGTGNRKPERNQKCVGVREKAVVVLSCFHQRSHGHQKVFEEGLGRCAVEQVYGARRGGGWKRIVRACPLVSVVFGDRRKIFFFKRSKAVEVETKAEKKMAILMAEDAVRLVLFLILIMVIDTGACILGLEAAVRGHKLRCGESTVSVWMLVLGAALLLVMVQLLACWVSGDLDGPEAIRDRQLTRTCLAFSWSTIIYGIPVLLVGALCSSCANCNPASKYCLPIGGILCFVHGLWAVAYCVCVAAIET